MSVMTDALKEGIKKAAPAIKEGVKKATPVIKEGVKQAWQSEAGKQIRKEVAGAAVEIGTGLAADAIEAGSEKVVTTVMRKAGPRAGRSVEEALDKSVRTRVKKLRAFPMTERERNERILGEVGKLHNRAASVVQAGENIGKFADVTSTVASVTAGGAAVASAVPGAPVVAGVAKTTGLIADAVNLGVGAVTEVNKKKARNILEDAQRITTVPPKEDILLHFGQRKEKYVKQCPFRAKEFGVIPIKKKQRDYLESNAVALGNKALGELLAMYCGYSMLTPDAREWVEAAWGYVHSPATMVPHAVPRIGFADDRVVISYVAERIKEMLSPLSIKIAEGLRDDIKNSKGEVNESGEPEVEQVTMVPDSAVVTPPVEIDKKEGGTSSGVPTKEEVPAFVGGIKTMRNF